MEQRYKELIEILDATSQGETTNIDLHISYVIADWIHTVQSAFIKGEIKDEISLKDNATVEWRSHSRMFDLTEFTQNQKDGFRCKIQLKRSVDNEERTVEFDLNTVAATFKLLSNHHRNPK